MKALAEQAKRRWRLAVGAVLTGVCAASTLYAADDAPRVNLHIVGGLAGVHQYTQREEPFWTKELPRLSGGRYGADIVPFDRAGLTGADMLRLVQLGVVPFGTVLLATIAARHPEYLAPDLAGLNPDIATLRRSMAAFRPYLESNLRQQHKVEALAVYIYPAQVLFCKRQLGSLSQVRGRRVRVSSTSQADFIAALGGLPIQVEFAKLMDSMSSGNTECAITGTMSGHTIGLDLVTTHVYTLPITWGVSIFVANRDAWEALPSDLRALLRSELPKLERDIWAESERETAEGLACSTGQPTCKTPTPARLQATTPTEGDLKLREQLVAEQVLGGWARRCGERCRTLWMQTLGPLLHLDLPTQTP